MGYYINETSTAAKLPDRGKAKALLQDGGTVTDPSFKDNLICVVENQWFDDAGYCYDEREFEVFNTPDGRKKTWLVHPKAKEFSDYK